MNNYSDRPMVTCDNMMIIDADFVDRVAFDLIVNFERIIGRPIPNADIARWIDCLALDGGIREGHEKTQVVLIHSRDKTQLDYFTPGNLEKELNGKAFNDNLGEFSINAISEESIINREGLLTDTLQLALYSSEVRRLIIVPDEQDYDLVRATLRHSDTDKQITVLAMQPMPGGHFQQEILGYSLMSALGIRSEELDGATTT
jgi:hypothetical protein